MQVARSRIDLIAELASSFEPDRTGVLAEINAEYGRLHRMFSELPGNEGSGNELPPPERGAIVTVALDLVDASLDEDV